MDIRALRKAKGWTQAELATRLGTDHVTVSRWERGVSVPRPGVQRRLRELLGHRRPARIHAPVHDPEQRLRDLDRFVNELRKMKADVSWSR
jgi:transcriptional regulator with XRE-family HTH domain